MVCVRLVGVGGFVWGGMVCVGLVRVGWFV